MLVVLRSNLICFPFISFFSLLTFNLLHLTLELFPYNHIIVSSFSFFCLFLPYPIPYLLYPNFFANGFRLPFSFFILPSSFFFLFFVLYTLHLIHYTLLYAFTPSLAIIVLIASTTSGSYNFLEPLIIFFNTSSFLASEVIP